MKTTRYATSRQKACQQCSVAKARCDRKERCCSRCAQRGLACLYPHSTSNLPSTSSTASKPQRQTSQPHSQTHIPVFVDSSDPSPLPSFSRASGGSLPSPERDELSPQGTQDPATPSAHTGFADNSPISFSAPAAAARAEWPVTQSLDPPASVPALQPEFFDFSNLDLICPINPEEISNRWLNAYIPIPGQSVKNYPPTVAAFIYRLLKSYTGMAVHGRGFPPFVHTSQLTAVSPNPQLSSCLSIVRICDKPLPGSENATAEIVQREMNNLYEQRDTYDHLALLSAFQAFLMYTMVLFFRLSQGLNPFLRQAMMNLQEFACVTARQGLMCLSEQQHTRPKWESWIIAEASRRTLFTMYLFDSVLSSEDGLPTFLGIELEGLPAVANKTLWFAQTRRDWETAYNIHLAAWDEGSLRINELWPIPEGLDESIVAKRRRRVDSWLEDLDEFGTMLYAVTSCTHGG
ncbi:hypothetical protein TrVGV298_002649 [Trichoderma virens]|nr:hypothetical protein TrVGV298_002649 [Trichoderma virens]